MKPLVHRLLSSVLQTAPMRRQEGSAWERPGARPAAEQRGAALLTAMIVVTLIASLAAAMVWQQYRAVQIEAAERARAQSGWILQGALDWARLILLEDAKADRRPGGAPTDNLGEVWAVPLAEARLTTFLAADKENAQADDGPAAFLAGNIVDLQSRYNLRQLLTGEKVPPLEQRTLERLCETVGVAPNTANALIKALRESFGTTPAAGNQPGNQPGNPPGDNAGTGTPPRDGNSAGNGNTPAATTPPNGTLQPTNLDQLTWLGLPADAVEKLRPFVVLLPRATPVNLNTAPREVIAALFDGMDLASAERLVQSRKAKPLRTADDAKAFLPNNTAPPAERAAFSSSFFEVTGRLRLEERLLEQRSLIERRGLDMVVLARERVSQILDTPR